MKTLEISYGEIQIFKTIKKKMHMLRNKSMKKNSVTKIIKDENICIYMYKYAHFLSQKCQI